MRSIHTRTAVAALAAAAVLAAPATPTQAATPLTSPAEGLGVPTTAAKTSVVVKVKAIQRRIATGKVKNIPAR